MTNISVHLWAKVWGLSIGIDVLFYITSSSWMFFSVELFSQRATHKGRPKNTRKIPNLQYPIMGGTDQELASETPCLGPTIWGTRRFVLLLFTEVFRIISIFLSILWWQKKFVKWLPVRNVYVAGNLGFYPFQHLTSWDSEAI